MKIGRAVYCNTEDGIRVGQVIGILKEGQVVAGSFDTLELPIGATGLYVQFDKDGSIKAFIPEGKAHKVRDSQAEQFVRDIIGVPLVGGYVSAADTLEGYEGSGEVNDDEEEETCEDCGEYESECVCD